LLLYSFPKERRDYYGTRRYMAQRGKYEGLKELAQLPRIPKMRTSENSIKAKFAEFLFHELG
jgi:hypothetical protein